MSRLFHETVMGHRFFESQLPELIDVLKRIAIVMEKIEENTNTHKKE